ncbi:hypothetical protein M199_gp219 [Halogranum tailed virus 1]|uniref:Uncharacterized protein n=1 Tax=Halogranum tailed virus 1 TaxID=1273749 RepID=R4TL96_9CAUD|nr:hypothetical protein M199_gp219 [Halogranum tailed virus 1]AGM11447.1 hypothetical protein HGTV1_150 [Halogranum tailed virus 1]
MTVTNYDSEDSQHYIETIRDNSHYTFVFNERGDSGAVLKSVMVDGFSLSPSEGRTNAEALGEARRRLLAEVEHIEDVYVPSRATVVLDDE